MVLVFMDSVIDTVSVFLPPKIYVEGLTPSATVLRDQAAICEPGTVLNRQ